MTEVEATSILTDCIQLVRKGEFTTLYNDQKLAELEQLHSTFRESYLGAQCAAILAETYDQVGKYERAREFANYEVGKLHLKKLEHEVGRQEPIRDAVRAQAWLILQCAVNQFRSRRASEALLLLDRAIELVTANSFTIRSQHIQSLFYFWRGRILSTAKYSFRDADADFEMALRVADRTLEEKLDAAESWPMRSEEASAVHLTAAMYVLSTILGFGLAMARQLESRLLDSLWFLRAAVPLSRVNQDVHRRGFAHLLMGTALRGTAQRVGGNLELAVNELRKASRLLSGSQPHVLYLARVSHQLALSHYHRVPPGIASSEEDKEHLREAQRYNLEAEDLHNRYPDEFRDPLLTYGITVAASLIETGLGNFDRAMHLVDRALETIDFNMPQGTHGWALLAKGIARAERVSRGATDADIADAEQLLRAVSENSELRPTDQAAALLHLARMFSRVGQPFKAMNYAERAEPLEKRSEHGWLKDLSESTSKSLGSDAGPELTINIPDMLAQARAQGKDPVAHISSMFDKHLKRRILALNEIQVMLQETNGEQKVADALGLTRATLFNWKRDEELKNFFPSIDKRRR